MRPQRCQSPLCLSLDYQSASSTSIQYPPACVYSVSLSLHHMTAHLPLKILLPLSPPSLCINSSDSDSSDGGGGDCPLSWRPDQNKSCPLFSFFFFLHSATTGALSNTRKSCRKGEEEGEGDENAGKVNAKRAHCAITPSHETAARPFNSNQRRWRSFQMCLVDNALSGNVLRSLTVRQSSGQQLGAPRELIRCIPQIRCTLLLSADTAVS